jgi:hypothetical protein
MGSGQNGHNGPSDGISGGKALSSAAAERVYGKHGGYRNLKAYQVAELLYDFTCRFCDRYIPKSDRHHRTISSTSSGGDCATGWNTTRPSFPRAPGWPVRVSPKGTHPGIRRDSPPPRYSLHGPERTDPARPANNIRTGTAAAIRNPASVRPTPGSAEAR